MSQDRWWIVGAALAVIAVQVLSTNWLGRQVYLYAPEECHLSELQQSVDSIAATVEKIDSDAIDWRAQEAQQQFLDRALR